MDATLTHVTENGKRAGIYLRAGLDREGKGQEIARQEEACRRSCEQEGYEVAAVYADNGKSASGRREKYEAMLADVRAGKLDVLVAYSPSRFTRRLPDALDLIKLAEISRVEIRTVASGQLDLPANGGGTAKVIAAFDLPAATSRGRRGRTA